MDDTCWQCGGEGHLGSACIDDMCHGGDIPCCHGEMYVIPCDACRGRGEIADEDEDGQDVDPESPAGQA